MGRLVELGLARHEAIHAIGASLALMEGAGPDASNTLRKAVPRWLFALSDCGLDVPDDLADVVAERREASISWLLSIAAHEVDHPQFVMLAAHTATMLGRFEVARAAPLLVRLLDVSDPDDMVTDAILRALPAIGEPALEPLLARIEASPTEDEQRLALFEMVCQLGVQDERIFRALADVYFEEPPFYSMCLADYGDRRGLRLIHRALHDFELTGDVDRDHFILEHVHAIESLGGCLTARERSLFATYEDLRLQEFPGTTRTTPKRLGRNAPCWCGSGRKYKHCHWVEDARG